MEARRLPPLLTFEARNGSKYGTGKHDLKAMAVSNVIMHQHNDRQHNPSKYTSPSLEVQLGEFGFERDALGT